MIKAVYADGGCIQKNPSTIGITWATCHVDENDQRVLERSGVVVPERGGSLTNNVAEMVAVVEGIETLPEGWSGTIYSDSRVTLGRLFEGYARNGISDALWTRASAAVDRLGPVSVVRLDGHPTAAQLAAGVGKRGGPVSHHQVWCDQRCTKVGRWHVEQLRIERSKQERLDA